MYFLLIFKCIMSPSRCNLAEAFRTNGMIWGHPEKDGIVKTILAHIIFHEDFWNSLLDDIDFRFLDINDGPSTLRHMPLLNTYLYKTNIAWNTSLLEIVSI